MAPTPIIPPLLVNNKLIFNLGKRLTSLSNFFVQQCYPDIDIDCGKMLKLINGLNSHKTHGHDGVSIRMVKLCNLTITKPLSIIYKNCLDFFQMTGKR